MNFCGGSYSLMLTGAILIFAVVHSAADGKNVIEVYDPNGKPTTLFYDGGRIQVTCTFSSSNDTDKISFLRIKDSKHSGGTPLVAAKGDPPKVEHSISLNHGVLDVQYSCYDGDNRTMSITIKYLLCNPTLMPAIDCTKPNEYCHVTLNRTEKCHKLEEANCQYKQIPPKFGYVCSIGGALGSNGICAALSKWDESRIHFVGRGTDVCRIGAIFSLAANNVTKRQRIHMNERVYIDVRYATRIYIRYDWPHYMWALKATVGDNVISSHTDVISGEEVDTALSDIVEDIKKLSQPANITITITCSVTFPFSAALYFSAQLLVYNPDRDFHYSIKEKKLGTTASDSALIKLSVEVKASKGLYACVKEGIDGCVPAAANSAGTVKTIIEYKLNGPKHMKRFYIGLFTSSPKKRHVLLYHKIINHTIQEFAKGSTIGDRKNATAAPVSGSVKLEVKGGMAVITMINAMFAMIMMMMMMMM